MMKRCLATLFALLLLVGIASAEKAGDSFLGTWYVTQLVSGGTAFSLADMSITMMIELKEDGTGIIKTSDEANEEESACAWTQKDDGTASFMESAMQVAVPLKKEQDYLILGDENDYYILRREPGEPVSFAETVIAKAAAEFNGEYAVTHVSGNGFTLEASAAMEEMAVLGAENTSVVIRDGRVALLGNAEVVCSFLPEEGVLSLETGDEAQNIRIFRLADGGIAVNWYGLTFFAAPVR